MTSGGPSECGDGDRRSGGDPPNFDPAIVHLYRAEMHRMTVWRQRLDVTANWAILLMFALTTFALGSPEVPHFTFLLGLVLIGISLLIEGRRYRHLHHSGWRLYLIESGYFAELLQPTGAVPVARWRERLAEDLRFPRLRLSWFRATCVRLRRNYLMILLFAAGAWMVKLFVHPQRPASAGELFGRMAVGPAIPSWVVGVAAVALVVGAAALAALGPSAEKLEKWGRSFVDPPTGP